MLNSNLLLRKYLKTPSILVLLLSVCAILAIDDKRKLEKPETDLNKLNQALTALVGYVGAMTSDFYPSKKSLKSYKRGYYVCVDQIKNNKVLIDALPREEKLLFNETLSYVKFIEKEFNHYVKGLNPDFTEKEYIEYVKKIWSIKDNGIRKMDKIDAEYQAILMKTKYYKN